MTREELDRGIEFLVGTTDAPKDELRKALTAFADAASAGEKGVEFPAFDKRLGKEGGYAFLWGDVLAIGEICEDLVTGGILLPTQLAAVLKTLLTSWLRLRKVRVELSENEFKIMRAVSRGQRELSAVAKLTGLPDAVVRDVVSELAKRKYAESVPLIESDAQGLLSTRF